MPTSKTKAWGRQNWAVQALTTGAHVLVFGKKTVIPQRVKTIRKNFLVTCFVLTFSSVLTLVRQNVFDKMNKPLFVHWKYFVLWLAHTKSIVKLPYTKSRDFFSLLSTRASALWCCRLARHASSLTGSLAITSPLCDLIGIMTIWKVSTRWKASVTSKYIFKTKNTVWLETGFGRKLARHKVWFAFRCQ